MAGSDGRGAGRVHVGAIRVDAYLPGSDSLKAKRSIINKAKAGLRNDLELSVAEVGFQDLWQRAALGVAVAGGTITQVDEFIDKIVPRLERDPRLIVTGIIADVYTLDEADLDIPPGLT